MFFVQPPIVPSGSIILYAGNNIPPNTTTSVPSALGSGLTVGITQNDAYQHTHDVNIPSFNTGSNNPPYLTLNYIIKI